MALSKSMQEALEVLGNVVKCINEDYQEDDKEVLLSFDGKIINIMYIGEEIFSFGDKNSWYGEEAYQVISGKLDAKK